jgi:hypothetical protein
MLKEDGIKSISACLAITGNTVVSNTGVTYLGNNGVTCIHKIIPFPDFKAIDQTLLQYQREV